MAAIIKETIRVYVYILYDLNDSRSDNMFLMQTVWQPVSVVLLYLYIVFSLGPRLMENRRPMKIEFIMKMYNLIQICLSMYMLKKALAIGWTTKYRWVCEPVDYADTPENLETVRSVWMFMMLKLIDLADTIFFILRKKSSHVTFLHVYHHGGVFLGAWFITKLLPGGHGTFLGCINCFVHIIMYTYYFITMQWPQYKNRIWWKKYITQLQMAQFLLMTLQSLPVLFLKECNYPKPIAGVMVFQYSFMFILFCDFYRKTYLKKIT